MPRQQRTTLCTPHEASRRAAIAQAYLESAELAMTERAEVKEEHLSVAAGAAILAGIAASDAICGSRLGQIHHGHDHRDAVDLLKRATPDGKSISLKLARFLDMKDQAHYGIYFVSARKASDAVKAARILVARPRKRPSADPDISVVEVL